MRHNPFPHVSGRYGAPMGRRHDTPSNFPQIKTLFAQHQGGTQGYDRGGAYWGYPANVWAVWGRMDGQVITTYVRAPSREAAIQMVREF